MEERKAKLLVNKSGGTASAAGVTFRATLPSKWIREMGLDENTREIQLEFDGERICITKINEESVSKG